MNASEELENVHLLVVQTLDNLPESEWETPIADDGWTVKDIVSHITSYVHVLLDMCHESTNDGTSTPYLTDYLEHNTGFDQRQVDERSNHTAQQVMDEFEEVQTDTVALLAHIPGDTLNHKGAVKGFEQQSIGDVVAEFSAHIRRHCNEITEYRNREQQ